MQVNEHVGRAIFDSQKAKMPIHAKCFLEREGVAVLSADRLDYADRVYLAMEHERQRGRPLRGWASIDMRTALDEECSIEADPIPSNKWHCHILLPDDCVRMRDAATILAMKLARKAIFITV